MPHFLMRRTKDDGKLHSYDNPIMVSMRYACDCANGEMLQISTVFDISILEKESEENFIWTMKLMWRDMRIEIEQHVKGAKTAEITPQSNQQDISMITE